MHSFLRLLAFVIMVCNFSISFAEKIVVLAADRWCPYNCAEDDKNRGIVIDLLSGIFATHDIVLQYKVMSMEDAIKGLMEGSVDAVIGANKTDLDASNTELIPLPFFTKVHAYTLPESEWVFDESSLDVLKVGFTSRYMYPRALQSYISNTYPMNQDAFVVVSDADSVAVSINSLSANLIDVFFDNPTVIEYYMKNNPDVHLRDAGEVPAVTQNQFTIAFNKNKERSMDFASKLSVDLINNIANSGEFSSKARQRYGVNELKDLH